MPPYGRKLGLKDTFFFNKKRVLAIFGLFHDIIRYGISLTMVIPSKILYFIVL
jgi:hypothetical protein